MENTVTGQWGCAPFVSLHPRQEHINSRSVAVLGVGRVDVEVVMAKGQGG